MQKIALRILTLAACGLAIAGHTAVAQQAPPRWKPNVETITVSAMAAAKNLRAALTGTHFSEAFAVSASIPVPYSDLNLSRDADAGELDRRIHVAARVVCAELDIKYPPTRYPTIAGGDCEQVATSDGLTQASLVIAAAKK